MDLVPDDPVVEVGGNGEVIESSNAVNPVLNPETQIDEPKPDAEKPEQKEEALPKGVQRRIDRAVRQKYEAEARTKMLEERLAYLERNQFTPQKSQQQSDNSEPTLDKFENFDDYVRAKAEWIADQRFNKLMTERDEKSQKAQQERYQREVQSSWSEKISKATAEMPDFEDVIASSDIPMTDVMQQAIMDSDVGPRLAYWLAQNPDEAMKIANMNPVGAVRTLGRIEERLQTPVKKTTNAPEPLKPIGSKASTSKDPGKMTDAEYAKWRKTGKAA